MDGRLIPRIPWLRVLLGGIVFVTAIALAFLIGAELMRQVTVPGAMTAAIVLIMLALFGKGLTQDNRAAWASYLVSLGIFGTFLGITVALLSFDPRAVEQSVPELLSGMQIAFISSAVGLFLSLMLRWKNVSGTVRGPASEGRSARDIYAQLTLLRKESKDAAERIRQSLDHLAETLTEDDRAASKHLKEIAEGVKRQDRP